MIHVRTLTDGGQEAADVARELLEFFVAAEESLDIAIYDIGLHDEVEQRGRDVLAAEVAEGVSVRLVYELERDGRPPVPPPPRTEPAELEEAAIPTHGVPATFGLMHHKYVIRDGRTVWTGSTNWTTDSWERQENVIVTVDSEELAYAYTLNMNELWGADRVADTGTVEPRPVDVGDAVVRPWFCPGHGEELAHRVAKYVGKARHRIRVASPVLTSGPILATLVEVVNEGRCDVAGVIDDTQTDQVFEQWRTNGVSAWKVPLLRRILEGAGFSGKPSTPWHQGSVHDYMHAKVVVADDTAFVGSFNFSRSGERNAENVLEIRHRETADALAAYVERVCAAYPPATPG